MVVSTESSPNPNDSITAFEGAITTSSIPYAFPPRAFAHNVVFDLTNQYFKALSLPPPKPKPPLHFHPYQNEYIAVIEGSLGLTLGSDERILRPTDGEVCIPAWTHHRLYPIMYDEHSSSGGKKQTQFILSGEETNRGYRLDTEFLKNWYGYQDAILMKGENGGKMDLVQVLCMFDAGGSYLSLPWWVPFGSTLSVVTGVVVGRWIGSVLGYQPFYKQWTSDWQLACDKMRTSLLQRRFADQAKIE